MASDLPTRATASRKIAEPAAAPATLIPMRERLVKRYVATCLLTEIPGVASDCEFIVRKKPELHETRIAAIVEAIRHIRAAHENEIVVEKRAKRTTQVQRTVVGEELVD